MATSPVMDETWEGWRARIDSALTEVVGAHVRAIEELDPALTDLGEELSRFVLGGGKRLRPLLLLLGHELGGGEDPDAVLGPALAVELVHTCALIHDDVIDRAERRRGGPSAHVSLAARRGVGPEADRFGEAAAILLGDLAHVIADDLFLDADVHPDRSLRAFTVFVRMRTEVTVGQYLDILAAGDEDADADLALRIAGYKSGRYSVARPLEIGALLAGADAVATELAEIGVGLGQAFQLRDDVLGVFGAEEETGKSALSDLAEGKRTYLVARTLEGLDGEARRRVLTRLGDPAIDERGAAEVRELMRTSGGLAATERRISELVEDGLERLDRADLPSAGAARLAGLARYLAERRS